MRRKLIETLEEKRAELGMTQTHYCTIIGVNPKTYWHIVHGNGNKVTLDSLVLYLLRLGITVEFSISDGTIKQERAGK